MVAGVLRWLESTFASPRGMLWLHRAHIVECVVAQLGLSISFGLFSAKYGFHLELFPAWIWKIGTPLFLNFFVVNPHVVIAELRCRRLVRTFERNARPVGRELYQLLREGVGGATRLLQWFLICWYVFVIVWRYSMEPCREFKVNWHFWVHNKDALPCEVIEFTCTLMVCANAVSICNFLLALEALRVFPENFSPPPNRGLPEDVLKQFPVCPYQSLPQDQDISTTCSICLCDYEPEDQVRKLPCGHLFHMDCSDRWLCKSSTCPMRCTLMPDDDNDDQEAAVSTQPADPSTEQSSPAPAEFLSDQGASSIEHTTQSSERADIVVEQV